jgi:hypothetical protein
MYQRNTTSSISNNTNTLLSFVLVKISLLVLAGDTSCSFGDGTSNINLVIENGSCLTNAHGWNNDGNVGEDSDRDGRELHLEWVFGRLSASRSEANLYRNDRSVEMSNILW